MYHRGHQHFPDALDKIIAAEGAYVDELDNCKGRRKRDTRKFVTHRDCEEMRAANKQRYRSMLNAARAQFEPERTSPRRPVRRTLHNQESQESD